MTKYNVGDEIEVKVGNRTFNTYIDEHSVQRFVENSVIKAFVDSSLEDFDLWISTKTAKPPFSLNDLAKEYAQGKHSLDDMLTFYTSFGYSVSGFADLSYFEELEIRNPVWEVDSWSRLTNNAWKELMGLINEPYEHNGNESVRFIFDAVRDGKWKTNDGDFITADATIDRVVLEFLNLRGIDPWDIKPEESTSKELKDFLKHLS